jgi:hypothetical protein
VELAAIVHRIHRSRRATVVRGPLTRTSRAGRSPR